MEINVFGPSVRDEVIELTTNTRDIDIGSDDYSLDENIRVSCEVNRNGDLAIIKGKVFAPVKVNCARCLEPFDIEVYGIFSLVVEKMPVGVPVPELTEEEEDMEEARILYVEHDIAKLDITEYVRDAVILALPLKPVCREDCKGLCVNCGQNLNEKDCGCERKISDPRWKGLSEIF